jgi:4-hydroxybenzoate polyprenyltransferase
MGDGAAATVDWRVHLRLGRVSNLPTVWTNTLAGAALAGIPTSPARVTALALAFSLFYVGGMYLNDAFDRDVDSRERPERPIPSGRITAAAVFGAGFGLLAAALGVLALAAGRHRWAAVAAGLVLAGAITLYDAWHKANPVSPVLMGLCRVLVYVTAAVALAGHAGGPVLGGAAVLLAYLIGLTYVAKQENLSEVRNLWPLGFLAAPFLYALPSLVESAVTAVLYLGFLGWVVYAVALLTRKGGPEIRRAVVSLIAGISLLDATLIARTGDAGVAAVAVLGFGLTLLAQRWVPGT